jgi:hypothetical protein
MRRFRGLRKAEYVALAFACAAAGCRSQRAAGPPGDAPAVVVWKPVGEWSGRGNRQTESFTSDTGGFRFRWETRNAAAPEAGRLHVVFRSGDSGREIIDAVDERGEGRGEEEVSAERPRWYYLTIESTGVDWTVRVDERIDARLTGSP